MLVTELAKHRKTDRGRRSIALDATTVRVLRQHHKQQASRDEPDSGIERPDHWCRTSRESFDLVFCDAQGQPLKPNRITQAFSRQVRQAGRLRIRFHDLRHTHATLALQAGIHPKIVSERLGHATISTTLDIYSHAMPVLHENAAETIAALIS